MQFMADIYLRCEGCGGKRFKQEVLEVMLDGKNVSDILDMTVDEAVDFFRTADPKMADKLLPLQAVGLGYIGLFLLHSPYGGREARLASWRALEDAVEAGEVKMAGVSNYGNRHVSLFSCY